MKKKMETLGKKASEQSFCELIGPACSEFLRRVGPPEEARRHFDAALTRARDAWQRVVKRLLRRMAWNRARS